MNSHNSVYNMVLWKTFYYIDRRGAADGNSETQHETKIVELNDARVCVRARASLLLTTTQTRKS